MATNPSYFMQQQFTDAGAVAALYLLDTFESGTTTPATTWQDAAEVAENKNPIVLDAAGRCTIFLDPALLYTFRLSTPGGTTVWTRDSIAGLPVTEATQFLPLDGSQNMTGLFALSGNATEALHPVPLQQMEDYFADTVKTAATVSIADAGSLITATDVEGALQELAESKVPTVTDQAGKFLTNDGTDLVWSPLPAYRLASADGSAASRTVRLAVGTYQVMLQTHARISDPGNYSFSTTQAASVGSASLSTSIPFSRSGGSGFGRIIHGSAMDVDTLVIATEADTVMQINSVVLSGASACTGSLLTVERIS